MASSAAGSASPGTTGTLHVATSPRFSEVQRSEESAPRPRVQTVLICLSSGPAAAAPRLLPLSPLAHLLHSHVLLVLPHQALPLLSGSSPGNLQYSPGGLLR